MAKRITKQIETPAADAPVEFGGITPPAAFLARQGLGPRDIALLDKYALALNEVREGLYAGDSERIAAAYPNLLNLAREAEKVRGIARKAISKRAAPAGE